MGFLTRLIAGFVAASTLGAGLAGTANAVDAARASATGVIGHHCSDAVALFIRDEWEARTR